MLAASPPSAGTAPLDGMSTSVTSSLIGDTTSVVGTSAAGSSSSDADTLGWTSCFNASAARSTYAAALYGSSAAAFEFDWQRVDVIYAGLISSLNKSCLHSPEVSRATPVYRKSIVGAPGVTFVNYTLRSNIANGGQVNLGGQRTPGRIVRWPWTEVTHSPNGGDRFMASGNLWMYVARGSGLWFDPGRVLELSDTFDLAIYLNLTRHYHSRSTGSKSVLLQNGAQTARPIVAMCSCT